MHQSHLSGTVTRRLARGAFSIGANNVHAETTRVAVERRARTVPVVAMVRGTPVHDARRSAMTEVWPPPEALVEHLRSSSRNAAVHEHAIKVRTGWWNAQKDLPGGPLHATGDNGAETICRADLFALAEDAVNDKSGTRAQALLWHTLAWGTGLKHRNNKRRIKSVLEKTGGALLLRDAALASREDPAAAFSMLRPGRRNAFAWLGPNFFTKYLYFAGAATRITRVSSSTSTYALP